MNWFQQLSTTTCAHIHKEVSGHCILLLDTNPVNHDRRSRFHFDNRWVHKVMSNMVREAWEKDSEGSRMYKIVQKIKFCKRALLK